MIQRRYFNVRMYLVQEGRFLMIYDLGAQSLYFYSR